MKVLSQKKKKKKKKTAFTGLKYISIKMLPFK